MALGLVTPREVPVLRLPAVRRTRRKPSVRLAHSVGLEATIAELQPGHARLKPATARRQPAVPSRW
jgi:hypothetical protein